MIESLFTPFLFQSTAQAITPILFAALAGLFFRHLEQTPPIGDQFADLFYRDGAGADVRMAFDFDQKGPQIDEGFRHASLPRADDPFSR